MLKRDFDLSARNTFRMKVRCGAYLDIDTEEELEALFRVDDLFSPSPVFGPEALPKPVMVMGGGSNLLFRGDYPGTVLHIGIKGIEETVCGDEVHFRVGAGEVFDDFCAMAAARGLWGPENLSLIPGECGASAVQNIGAYGVEAKDIILSVRAWDLIAGTWVEIPGSECAYGYRSSNFKSVWKGRYIITYVTYRLWTTPHPVLDYGGLRKELQDAEPTPQLLRDTIIGIRRRKLPDPEEIGSAGSFFCNPVISREHFERIVSIARAENGAEYAVPHFEVGDMIKVPAAWMIEQCGFKGATLGGAQVYRNQPLVIVNASGEASPEDVIGLEQRIIDTIREKYGIVLHPEVEHI